MHKLIRKEDLLCLGDAVLGQATLTPGHGLAPESALRSHPCVALSSAPVQISINPKLHPTGYPQHPQPKKLPENRLIGYNKTCPGVMDPLAGFEVTLYGRF